MSKQPDTRLADAIKQARDEMDETDETLAEAMQKFTQATGLEVKHVEITVVLASMEVVDYHVKSELAL